MKEEKLNAIRAMVEAILQREEDCAAINRNSLKHAEDFLRNLELQVPLPFVGCEPSGRVGIEWIGEKMRVSVGFNDDGSITYAGINKEGRVFNGRDKKGLGERIADFMKFTEKQCDLK